MQGVLTDICLKYFAYNVLFLATPPHSSTYPSLHPHHSFHSIFITVVAVCSGRCSHASIGYAGFFFEAILPGVARRSYHTFECYCRIMPLDVCQRLSCAVATFKSVTGPRLSMLTRQIVLPPSRSMRVPSPYSCITIRMPRMFGLLAGLFPYGACIRTALRHTAAELASLRD